MKNLVAIQIKFNMTTGARPPGVDVGGGSMWCGHHWQNLDKCEEIRLLKDPGMADQFEGRDDIKIIKGVKNIKKALAELCPPKDVYVVTNDLIMKKHIESAEINWEELDQQADAIEEMAFLYEKGIRGISKVTQIPQDPEDLATLGTL